MLGCGSEIGDSVIAREEDNDDKIAMKFMRVWVGYDEDHGDYDEDDVFLDTFLPEHRVCRG